MSRPMVLWHSRAGGGAVHSINSRLMHRSKRRSFNHLIGGREQHRRHGEAERLRGLEIDDKFELGRLLNGKIGWIGALQDAIHIVSTTPEHCWVTRPIGYETADADELLGPIQGRNFAR